MQAMCGGAISILYTIFLLKTGLILCNQRGRKWLIILINFSYSWLL